mgnify:CR=1 FL=1
MELSSEYNMWVKGPSKALKCLRYLLRNSDATPRMTANATGASYAVAWATKKDIEKYGKEAMTPYARFDMPDPEPVREVFRAKHCKPRVSALQIETPVDKEDALLDLLTDPDLDLGAIMKMVKERKLGRVTASTEETDERVLEPQVTKTPPLVTKQEKGAQVSDGSTASYYELPDGAHELQDLISHKNMNSQIGEIFRACYRMGEASHSDELRDAKKIRFYIDAEIERLLRK